LPTAVPVARAGDNAKAGKGTIYVDSLSTPSDDVNSNSDGSTSSQDIILKGSGSSFTTELGPKYQIQLGKTYGFPTVEVVQVIDDETVKIKKMFSKEKAVEDLKAAKKKIQDGQPGVAYKCLPYIDQTQVGTDNYLR
jgi:glycerol-3-phosphate O-acyltransferase/dihydroxyacetone phosphate acyltransferase